jgi:hypothetical protein
MRHARHIGHPIGGVQAGHGEVVTGGMSTAVAVIALLSKHLAVSLVAAHGVETTRRLCWRRRFSMRARPAMTETQQERERGPLVSKGRAMTAQARPPSGTPPPRRGDRSRAPASPARCSGCSGRRWPGRRRASAPSSARSARRRTPRGCGPRRRRGRDS